MKASGVTSNSYAHSQGSSQLITPYEGGRDVNPINKAIQRGKSATPGASAANVLAGNSHFHCDTGKITSGGSPRVAYLKCRGYGVSCDGFESKRAVAEANDVQNQIRSGLTLPHLEKFQTYSLDVHKYNCGSPKPLQATADGITQLDQPQCKSLDISPEYTVLKTKNQETVMPQIQPISIHVRHPSWKSSVQG